MELVRYNRDGSKAVLKNNATEQDFFDLMERAKCRYGLGCDNENGMRWPNAHARFFFANGFKFSLEFLSGFDFFDNK